MTRGRRTLGLLAVIVVIVAVSGAQTAGAASSGTATGAAATTAAAGTAVASAAPLPPKRRARLRAAVRAALRIAEPPGAVVAVQTQEADGSERSGSRTSARRPECGPTSTNGSGR
jgi:hypothetical protein